MTDGKPHMSHKQLHKLLKLKWHKELVQTLTIFLTSSPRRSPFLFSTFSMTLSVSSHTVLMSSSGLSLYPSRTCSYKLLHAPCEKRCGMNTSVLCLEHSLPNGMSTVNAVRLTTILMQVAMFVWWCVLHSWSIRIIVRRS